MKQLNRPLLKAKNKKVIDVMKGESGGEVIELKTKTCYLIDHGSEDKK